MSNRFWLILIAIAVIFFGLLITKKEATAPSEDGANTSVQATSHTKGEGTAGVTLVEYGDFECPACAGYYPLLKEVKDKYGDQITFQFRHYPLIQIHQNAMTAHRAAEAAAMQGKFWEMHDLLYERQESWKDSSNPSQIFEGYAQELSLDIEKFKQDANSSEVNSIIQADIRAGQELGVTGTPTFVINGEVIETPRSLDAFSEVIDAAIAEQQQNQ